MLQMISVSFYKNIKRHNCFNIDNNKNRFLSTKSDIRMISEGSCDTEDWSNDAEIQLYHHRNKFNFKILQ